MEHAREQGANGWGGTRRFFRNIFGVAGRHHKFDRSDRKYGSEPLAGTEETCHVLLPDTKFHVLLPDPNGTKLSITRFEGQRPDISQPRVQRGTSVALGNRPERAKP